MGIDGLLQLLKPVTQKQHLSSFRGKRVAVDAKAWLYKACYGYTFQLNQQIQTNQFMYYVIQMIQLLKHYEIDFILVFDGRSLEMKAQTNQKRRKAKEQNYQKALKSLQNDQYLEAQKYFSRCIKIDERIFSTALNCLRSDGIKFMIAPYEADSQIVKLFQMGEIDFAITQDSDFLVYGCKVLLKLSVSGDCDYIDLSTVDKQVHKQNIALYNYLSLSNQNRVFACVLAGCDYLSNIKRIGLRTAVTLLKKFDSVETVVQQIRKNKKQQVIMSDTYSQDVKKISSIFYLSKVYNSKTNQLQYLKSVDQYNKLNLSKQQLDSIVGKDYEYSKEVRQGKVQCNSFKQRQIKTINYKSFFFDKNNLSLQELRHRMRNKQMIKKQDFTSQQIQQASEMQKLHQQKLEQEKKKFQKQKKQRSNNLNGFLNSLMDTFDNDDEGSEKQNLSILIKEDSDNQQSQSSIPYHNLNPFAIKK